MTIAEIVITDPEDEKLTDRQQLIQLKHGRHPSVLICDMSSRGMSDEEIAEELEISKHTLKLWLSRLNIKPHRVLKPSQDSE